MHETFNLNVYEIFFAFFITLGPVKIILPFHQLTEHLSMKDRVKVAVHAEIISAIIILLLVVFGIRIIDKWGLSSTTISLTGGIIMFLQGLALVQLNPAQIDFVSMLKIQNKHVLTLKQITYYLIAPVIITPAGVTMILAARSFHYTDLRSAEILTVKVALIILLLNFAAMLATQLICKVVKPSYLQIIGWIFSIFLMILAVKCILYDLVVLNIVNK
jgi:multiple antibiotic resistance protein